MASDPSNAQVGVIDPPSASSVGGRVLAAIAAFPLVCRHCLEPYFFIGSMPKMHTRATLSSQHSVIKVAVGIFSHVKLSRVNMVNSHLTYQ